MMSIVYKFKTVPIEALEVTDVKIRDVYEDHDKFADLVRSIGVKGIEQPLVCRPHPTKKNAYQVGDGGHRLAAAKRNGLTEIPIRIKDMTDEEMTACQLICNTHRIPTKTKDIVDHIKTFMINHPTMTHSEVATEFCMKEHNFHKLLNLKKLTEKAATLVFDGQIKASAGYILSTLAPEDQDDDEVLRMAMTDATDKFVNHCVAMKKTRREEAKTGKKAEGPIIVAHLRKKDEILTRLNYDRRGFESMSPDDKDYATVAGGIDTLEWALTIDPDSLAAIIKEKKEVKAAGEEARLKAKQENAAKALAEYEERKTSPVAGTVAGV